MSPGSSLSKLLRGGFLMPDCTLIHHVDTAPDGWVSSVAVGAPPVTEAAERALRPVVMGKSLKQADDAETTKWWHCEGWAAVIDLHRAGRHDDALDVARLLHWCDQQANGRVKGYWEITR
jgi:hypothetical protein